MRLGIFGSWAAVLALASCLSLPASFAQAQPQAKRLVIGVSQYPSNFNPLFDLQMSRAYIHGMTRRPFTTYNADWKLICVLCVELPDLAKGTAQDIITPSGKRGRATTYRIDPLARWGDGVPITSKDVLFTWELGRQDETGAQNSEMFRVIENVRIIDDKTFTLVSDQRACNYANINDLEILPAHIEAEAAADPANYRNQSLYERDTTNKGLWAGPYLVKSTQPGSTIILERNPQWWGKSPYFDEIEIRTAENTAALMANLLSGDIDMIAGELGLPLDQALSLQERAKDRFTFVYTPGLTYEHIDLNLDNPLLKDVRVRRALLHAIDREALSQRLFAGPQPPAHGNVNPQDEVFYKDVPRYAYDPEKAKALLDEAGFRPGPGGVRQNAAGEPLRLEFLTTAGNKTRELVQQVLQSMWSQVGIQVQLRAEPPGVFFGEKLDKRTFQAMAMFAWSPSPRHVPWTTLHSSAIPSEANGWDGQNYPGYASAEMDEILDRLNAECDPVRKQVLWNRMQTLYAQDLPVLPLYFRTDTHILPRWLRGVQPTGHAQPSSLWVEDWRRLDGW